MRGFVFQIQICGCLNIVLLINISGESPALRVAANRWVNPTDTVWLEPIDAMHRITI